jgi:Ca-activated chloride channel family protein
MKMPTISVIPMHGAIAKDRSVTLDVLIKIEPPIVESDANARPPLNLGFVLDKSGSMYGDKLDYAKQAIAYAIQQLLPSDRLSLTLFDTKIETKIPSTLATDKQKLLETVKLIRSGSSTALHDGWVQGGIQVGEYLNRDHLNRVILLSDGLANVGETNPDVIASDVHGLMQTGITTSALGVGRDYDEDLLEAIARSGDGNFFHIASPEDLPQIFETELQGLATTLGRAVTLKLNPQAGTTVKEVLNDLEREESGAIKLPNLTVANPLKVVVRLRLPALSAVTDVLKVTLQWEDTDNQETCTQEVSLQLQVVIPEQLSDFPANQEVQEQVALLMAARARQEAIDRLDRGDMNGAVQSLQQSAVMLEAMPASAPLMEELSNLKDLAEDFEKGDRLMSRKRAMAEKYHLNRSRSAKYGKDNRNH